MCQPNIPQTFGKVAGQSSSSRKRSSLPIKSRVLTRSPGDSPSRARVSASIRSAAVVSSSTIAGDRASSTTKKPSRSNCWRSSSVRTCAKQEASISRLQILSLNYRSFRNERHLMAIIIRKCINRTKPSQAAGRRGWSGHLFCNYYFFVSDPLPACRGRPPVFRFLIRESSQTLYTFVLQSLLFFDRWEVRSHRGALIPLPMVDGGRGWGLPGV